MVFRHRATELPAVHDGRLGYTGTHEELSERCPLYRMLITGPDEEPEALRAAAGLTSAATLIRPRAGAMTSAAQGVSQLSGGGGSGGSGRGGGARPGPGRAGGRRHRGMLASLPPSRKLLAKVAALPPANDRPHVDDAEVRAPEPGLLPAPAAAAVRVAC